MFLFFSFLFFLVLLCQITYLNNVESKSKIFLAIVLCHSSKISLNQVVENQRQKAKGDDNDGENTLRVKNGF